jgi:hypothetical protein
MTTLALKEKVNKTDTNTSVDTNLKASTKSAKSTKKDIITSDDKYNMKVLGITDIRDLRRVERHVAEAKEDVKAGRVYTEAEFKKMFNFE